MAIASCWKARALGSAGKWLSGGTPSTAIDAYWGGDIPWISSGSLTNFRIASSDRRVTTEGSRNGTRVVPKDTILIVVRGMSLKKQVRIGITTRAVAFGQDCKALEPSVDFDPNFLAYAIAERHDHLLALVDEAGHGTGRLNSDQLFAVEVPVPSPAEQRAIAAVLSALDDKIAANERLAGTALELGDQLFARAAAETEWVATSIGELAARAAIVFSDGYRTKKAEHGQPGLRILRAGDVRDSYVYPAGDDYVSRDYSRQIGSKASMPGDIVLTTKGTVGRVAVVAEGVERVVYSPQVCYFRVKDESQVDGGFLGAWFRSSDLQRQAATLMYKSDMAPYISLRDIRSLDVPLPPIKEQRRIGEIQRNLLAVFDASRVESERLSRTRDELLPLLMSGKVRVKEAEVVGVEVI